MGERDISEHLTGERLQWSSTPCFLSQREGSSSALPKLRNRSGGLYPNSEELDPTPAKAMTASEQSEGPPQHPGQVLVTTPPIKGVMTQASRSASPVRGQKPKARTTVLQPAEGRPHTQKFRQNEITQRSMLQMKEQDKNLQELNEEEIGSLSEKELRVMIVR